MGREHDDNPMGAYKLPAPKPAAGRPVGEADPASSPSKAIDPYATVEFIVERGRSPNSPEVLAELHAWQRAHLEWQQHRRGPEPPRPDIGVVEAPLIDDSSPTPPVAMPSGPLRAYLAPKTLPPIVKHKTLEVETVKINPEADPRRGATQRSIRRFEPPLDGRDSAMASERAAPSTPPRRRGGVWAALASLTIVLVGGAIWMGLRTTSAPEAAAVAGSVDPSSTAEPPVAVATSGSPLEAVPEPVAERSATPTTPSSAARPRVSPVAAPAARSAAAATATPEPVPMFERKPPR